MQVSIRQQIDIFRRNIERVFDKDGKSWMKFWLEKKFFSNIYSGSHGVGQSFLKWAPLWARLQKKVEYILCGLVYQQR